MQFVLIQRILGIFLMLFSSTMLLPILVGWLMSDPLQTLIPFVTSFAIVLGLGGVIWLPVRQVQRDLRLRDGFLIAVLFWSVLGVLGALPFALSTAVPVSTVDAIFESISGLTTTGATVFPSLGTLPRSIIFYRQELQWFGGMAILVLGVAVLPVLNVGGMQVYRAVTPGVMKESNLAHRITATTKSLWYIYMLLTVLCAFCYWLAGMSVFDAVGHGFTTVSIGGFSTQDANLQAFDSVAVELVAMLFMLLAGINFGLHFTVWTRRSLYHYSRDIEVKVFGLFLFGLALISAGYLWWTDPSMTVWHTLRLGVFHAVSLATTTGFWTAKLSAWPIFLTILLLIAASIGGCAGSTAGGIKVIRFWLLLKQMGRELLRLIHPSAHVVIKVNGQVLEDKVIGAVWGFFALYVVVFIVFDAGMLLLGHDELTAFSATAATLNNMGIGLGEVASGFSQIDDASKIWLCLSMLTGRLELFTLLILFTPAFWRR